VDFRSLQVFAISRPCKTLRIPKLIQVLARHGTMELTRKICPKVDPTDLATGNAWSTNGNREDEQAFYRQHQKKIDRWL
jgi:hypothetical protein